MSEERGKFFYLKDLDADDLRWWWVFSSKRMGDLFEFGRRLREGNYPSDLVIQLRLYHGTLQGDYLAGFGDHIVSSKVVDIFRRYQCGDIRFIPTVLYDRKDEKVISRDYWCIVPAPGAAEADRSIGYYKLFDGSWRKDPSLHDAVGLHFDHSTWTGLDVFRVPKSPPLIFTKPVADELLKADLKGVLIGDILDYAKRLRDVRAAHWKEAAIPQQSPSGTKGMSAN